MRASGAVVLAALALCGCSGEPGSEPPLETGSPGVAAAAPPSSPLPTSCVGLEQSMLQAPATREGLRARFGEPDSTSVLTVPNRHVAGVTDSLFAVHYPGLVVNIHTPGEGTDIPDLVTVDDNRYLAFPRVGIGASADSVILALGEPTRRERGALVYDCGEAVEQPVRFELADERVRRIVIDHYVD